MQKATQEVAKGSNQADEGFFPPNQASYTVYDWIISLIKCFVGFF